MRFCEADVPKDSGNEEVPLFPMPDPIGYDTITTRRILLTGEISEGMAAYATSHLQFFSMNPNLPVFIYINSPGGDLFSGYSIIDQISLSRFPIFTIVRGQAVSMAAVIAAYGSPKCRFMTKNSCMMIHPTCLYGIAEGINSHKDYVKKFQLLSTRLKIGKTALKKLSDGTHWMTPKQAIKIGMVDGTWTKRHEAEVDSLRRAKR